MFGPLLSDVKKSRFYREVYQEAYQEAYQEVTEEVAQESSLKEKHKIAKSLLKKKMSLEFISEVTELSAKEIRALTKDLAGRKN